MKLLDAKNRNKTPIKPGWPKKIAPAYPGDEDWDYPPPIKEMISLLAKSAAIQYLDTLEQQKKRAKVIT